MYSKVQICVHVTPGIIPVLRHINLIYILMSHFLTSILILYPTYGDVSVVIPSLKISGDILCPCTGPMSPTCSLRLALNFVTRLKFIKAPHCLTFSNLPLIPPSWIQILSEYLVLNKLYM